MSTGFLTTFEGCEGSGKTSQVRLLDKHLDTIGIPHYTTREPGGTPLAENIRALLLGIRGETPTAVAELLLLGAARSQLFVPIEKRLKIGEPVIEDRSGDASYAYQGFGRFYGSARELDFIVMMNTLAMRDMTPRRTYFLDTPVEESLARKKGMNVELDRFEREYRDFHERVREGYMIIAKREPERVMIVDAMKAKEEVYEIILADYTTLLKEHGFTLPASHE